MKKVFKTIEYKIDKITYFKVLALEIKLLNRRILRLIRRITQYASEVFINFFCISVFMFAVGLIGFHTNKYSTIYDVLWDLKGYFLSSIIIVLSNSVIKKEFQRHKILIKQRNLYISYAQESENFIKDLLRIIDLDVSNVYLHIHEIIIELQQRKYNGYEININEKSDIDNDMIKKCNLLQFKDNQYFLPTKDYIEVICKRFSQELIELRMNINSDYIVYEDTIDYIKNSITNIKRLTDSLSLMVNKLNKDNISFYYFNILLPLIYSINSLYLQLKCPWILDYDEHTNKEIISKLNYCSNSILK